MEKLKASDFNIQKENERGKEFFIVTQKDGSYVGSFVDEEMDSKFSEDWTDAIVEGMSIGLIKKLLESSTKENKNE